MRIPIDFRGFLNPRLQLNEVDPENPHLFVPRSTGVGWNLNTGALAAHLGLIRPDDSLPDLADHLPQWWMALARYLPSVSSAGLGVAALRQSNRQIAVLAAVLGWWNRRAHTRGSAAEAIAASANAAGLQVLALSALARPRNAARSSTASPLSRALIPLGFLAVRMAVEVGSVKVALRAINSELASRAEQKECEDHV